MTPEPVGTLAGAGIVAAAIVAFGPLAGPYIVMIVWAFGGALVSLSASHTRGFWPSAGFVARGVFIGATGAGLAAEWAASTWGLSAAHAWLMPAAAGLGAVADKWTWLRDLLSRRSEGAPQ